MKFFSLVALSLALVVQSVYLHADDRTDDITHAGDIVQMLVPAAAWGTTRAFDDAEGRTQIYKLWASTLVTVHGLKFASEKARPKGTNTKSFPSGHTAAAMTGAAFLTQRYGIEYGAPALAATAFVAYSRWRGAQHYRDDTLAGASIAYLWALYFVDEYEDPALTFIPFYEDKTFGITMNAKW